MTGAVKELDGLQVELCQGAEYTRNSTGEHVHGQRPARGKKELEGELKRTSKATVDSSSQHMLADVRWTTVPAVNNQKVL